MGMWAVWGVAASCLERQHLRLTSGQLISQKCFHDDFATLLRVTPFSQRSKENDEVSRRLLCCGGSVPCSLQYISEETTAAILRVKYKAVRSYRRENPRYFLLSAKGQIH